METEMERLGRILAADQGLRVHIRGAKAYATKGEVVIPNIATFDMLGRDAKRMIHGLLDHETAHARFSDFNVVEAVAKLDLLFLGPLGPRVAKFKRVVPILLNAVEDSRIEELQGSLYLGARENLDRKNRWFWITPTHGELCGRDRIAKEEPMPAYMLAFCFVTRGVVTVDEIAKLNPLVHTMLERTQDLMGRVPTLHSTRDALVLAVEIAERLEEESKPKPKPKPEPKPEKGDDDGDEKGEGEEEDDESESKSSDGDDEEEADEDDEGDEPKSGSDKADEDGDEEEEGSEGKGEGDDEETDDEDAEESEEGDRPLAGLFNLRDLDDKRPLNPEDKIAQEILSAYDGPEDVRPYLVYSKEYDVELDLTGKGVDSPMDMAAVQPLIQAFEAALLARRERRGIPGHDEGEVDASLLAGFSLGAVPADELFLQYVSEDEKNTAVQIVVDCSGSMSRPLNASRADTARQACIAMSKALSAIGVPHEVVAFTTVSTNVQHNRHDWIMSASASGLVDHKLAQLRHGLNEQRARGVDTSIFAREHYRGSNELLIPMYAVLKKYDTDDLRGLARIQGIHENLDGEAIEWASSRLLKRPEPRKVMMVLSDGLPLGSRNEKQGARFLKESVKHTIDTGIEVCGVGIQSDAVSHFYPSWIRVDNLNHLAGEALTFLMQALMAGRQDG